MDVNGRAQLGETPGGAGVIEMNMAEEDVPDIARIGTKFAKFARQRVESRFRPGIEKHRPLIGLERSRGDNAASAEMLRIENVNHRFNPGSAGCQPAVCGSLPQTSVNEIISKRVEGSARQAAGRCRLAACAPHAEMRAVTLRRAATNSGADSSGPFHAKC